jgi:mono/diheme cytochrome c family protein
MAELIAYLYYLQYLGEPGNPLEGEKLFPEKGCIKCHSVGGKGGTIGPKLDEMKRYASPLYMAQAMWNHGPEMEVRMKELGIRRPRFEGREIVDLIAYIQKVSAGAPEEKVYMLPGNPTEGERLFVSKGCIDCHSVRGNGASIGPDLGKVELYRSVTEIVGIMWNHGPEMWQEMEKRGINRPRFSGEEMADIIAYLYFLKFVDEPGDRVEGEKLFSSKGCITCHSVKGKGEEIGPDLATSRGVSSPIEMVQVMWNHAPIMEKKMREKRLPWPEFKGKDMPNLFAYLQSISKGGATK